MIPLLRNNIWNQLLLLFQVLFFTRPILLQLDPGGPSSFQLVQARFSKFQMVSVCSSLFQLVPRFSMSTFFYQKSGNNIELQCQLKTIAANFMFSTSNVFLTLLCFLGMPCFDEQSSTLVIILQFPLPSYNAKAVSNHVIA